MPQKFEKVIFLGTGGSSLGGKTLISITENFLFISTKTTNFFSRKCRSYLNKSAYKED